MGSWYDVVFCVQSIKPSVDDEEWAVRVLFNFCMVN